MQIGVSNPNVPIFPPRVCTLVLFIRKASVAGLYILLVCVIRKASVAGLYILLLQIRRQCNIALGALFISNLSIHTHHTLSFGSVVPVLAPSPLYSFVWASLYQIQGQVLRGNFGSGGQ